MSLWCLNQNHFLPQAQQGRDSTLDCCSQEYKWSHLQLPVKGSHSTETSSEEQDSSVSHPAFCYLVLRLNSRQAQSRDGRSLPWPCPHLWNGDFTLGTVPWSSLLWLRTQRLYAKRGKPEVPQAAATLSPTLHPASRVGVSLTEKSAIVPRPAPEPWLKIFAKAAGKGKTCHEKSSWSLPKGTNFIYHRIWSSNLSVLLRTMEVVTSGNWKEILGFNEDTAYNKGCLVYKK